MPVKSQSEGLAGFWEEFEAQHDAGGFFMLIVHPFLTGRLARWRLVETWIEQPLKTRDVWFTSLGGIADHMDGLAANGTWSPSIETLPFFDAPPSQQ